MRKTSITAIFCFVLLVACTPLDVPPDPGFPGSEGPIGEASAAFLSEFAAYDPNPDNFLVSPSVLDITSLDTSQDITLTVTGEDYVYKSGYILNRGADPDQWAVFEFDENTLGSSNWIKGVATKTLPVQKDYLAVPAGATEDQTVELAVIAYACKKDTTIVGGWDCHHIGQEVGHWMARLFDVNWVNIPFDPAAPGALSGGFKVQDSTGATMAYFDDAGNLLLKGACLSAAGCDPSAPVDSAFTFRDSAGTSVAWVGSNGNICLGTASCISTSGPCTETANDEFIIKDSADVVVSSIDLTTGQLCLTGGLIQNHIFG